MVSLLFNPLVFILSLPRSFFPALFLQLSCLPRLQGIKPIPSHFPAFKRDGPRSQKGFRNDYPLSPRLVKLLERSGQPVPTPKRILELNLGHPLMAKLQKVFKDDPDSHVVVDHARLLYGQSLLAEGGALEDPAEFSLLVVDLMVHGLGE